MKTLKALSFFSGALGLDLGMEQAGIEIALACEIDKKCRETIKLNRPNLPLIDDINKYSSEDILQIANIKKDAVDIIFGGPPCQAFSTAGTRKGFQDERGNVFLKYIDIALEIKPKYIVIENVRGLLSSPLIHIPHTERKTELITNNEEKHGGALSVILKKISSNGYNYSFNLYNAANYGVPQIRERVVIICTLSNKKVTYLNPTHSDNPIYGLPRWVSLREALEGLDNKTATHAFFPEERIKYYKMLSAGQYWKNLPLEIQKQAMGKSFYSGGGKTGFYRRLSWEKPSCTLVTSPTMPATDICHPELDRPLSIEEYKRIQQFPDDWKLFGSLTDQYRQIGNAVPVGLGKAIGLAVVAHHNNVSVIPPSNFPFSRYKKCCDQTWGEQGSRHDKDQAEFNFMQEVA